MRSAKGFTLIELMITVAIVGILSAIAYPSYKDHVIKTRRASAKGCLLELAQYMDRYYTTNMRYTGATLPSIGCRTELTSYYTFGLSNHTATTYTATATATGSQLSDTTCLNLSINQLGTKSVSGSGSASSCW